MSDVLLIVPPLLRYLAGPLAGPAMLAGVGEAVGTRVHVLDLNALWLRQHAYGRSAESFGLVGDHVPAKEALLKADQCWRELVSPLLKTVSGSVSGEEPLKALWCTFDAVEEAALALASSGWGREVNERLEVYPPPAFVGVSVLWSGQVPAGLAATLIARSRWPGVPVIWGGAHVTALADRIAREPRFGRWIDGFVAGYAEQTFSLMCAGEPMAASGVFRAGMGKCPRALEAAAIPRFQELELYGVPRLHLPAQLGRGCAYGRCAFCTYPAQEGQFRTLSSDSVRHTLALAERTGAVLAFKDALLTFPQLEQAATLIAGRLPWAGCTRIVPRAGRERLERWVAGGLRTLELGVEALDPETLRRLDKRQRPNDLEALLEDAAGLELHLVLNVMFGFPGQTREEALEQARHLTEVLPLRFPATRFSTERNLLQVEANAPLARDPARYGITVTGEWPWSSVLDWNAPSWRRDEPALFQGHHFIERDAA